MRPEQIAKLRRELETPWNDLREQRVLAGVLDERRRLREPGARGALVVAAMLSVAGALGVAAWHVHGAKSAAIARIETSSVAPQEQRIELADGSRAALVHDARVQVVEQRRDLVHIAQQSGEVRYEVRPNAAREFVVFAPGITIKVRGTIFTVSVTDDRVEVRVQRGKVEVDDGAGKHELVAGESMGIPVRPVASGGDDVDAASDVEPAPTEPSPSSASAAASAPRPSAAELLAKADRARASGRQDDAARALQAVLETYPKDPRATDALFMLGKVDRVRERLADSAKDFERCWEAAPYGPLAEDAIAEAATSWQGAGSVGSARLDAQRYLARWPDGIQAPRMRAILGK